MFQKLAQGILSKLFRFLMWLNVWTWLPCLDHDFFEYQWIKFWTKFLMNKFLLYLKKIGKLEFIAASRTEDHFGISTLCTILQFSYCNAKVAELSPLVGIPGLHDHQFFDSFRDRVFFSSIFMFNYWCW